MRFSIGAVIVLPLLVPSLTQALADKLRTRNVVLDTNGGLRWQEVFRGADPALFNKDEGG